MAAKAALDRDRIRWIGVGARWIPPAGAAPAPAATPFVEIPLWRAGAHAGEDARDAAFALSLRSRPASATVIGLGWDGRLGALRTSLPGYDVLTGPATPATVAAVDDDAGGAPWVLLTLAALVDATSLNVVMPAGMSEASLRELLAVATPARALVERAALPTLFHAIG